MRVKAIYISTSDQTISLIDFKVSTPTMEDVLGKEIKPAIRFKGGDVLYVAQRPHNMGFQHWPKRNLTFFGDGLIINFADPLRPDSPAMTIEQLEAENILLRPAGHYKVEIDFSDAQYGEASDD